MHTLGSHRVYIHGIHQIKFDVWLNVHRSSVWSKKPIRCHLVLYLFLLYKLLYMFRATFCPSSGAEDLVVLLPLVVLCRGCVGGQVRLADCVSIGK